MQILHIIQCAYYAGHRVKPKSTNLKLPKRVSTTKITPCRDEDGHRSLSVDILKPDAIFGTFSVGQSYQGQRGLVQGIQSKVLRGRIIVP